MTDEADIVGKIVLVGVTYFDAAGQEVGRGQWWGRILAFNTKDGFRVDLGDSGKPHSFPPIPGALRPASPGTYELTSTGEQIDDPDYLYTFRSDRPPN